MTNLSPCPVPSDEKQIESWSDLEFHRSFLSDEVRNRAYQTALRQYVKSDSTVLDIGSGIGLLSFFAAQAGAYKTIGIDWSPSLIETANRVAERNNLADRVQFMNRDARHIVPGDFSSLGSHPDVVIHELFGGLVWDEDLAAILYHIRTNVAGPDTIFLPSRYEVYIVPITAPLRQGISEFWRTRRYDIDFSDFLEPDLQRTKLIPRATSAHICDDTCFLGAPILAFNEIIGSSPNVPAAVDLEFMIDRPGMHDGYLGYMQIFFGTSDTPIIAKPTESGTNWGQFIVPGDRAREVNAGDRLKMNFAPSRWSSDWAVNTVHVPRIA